MATADLEGVIGRTVGEFLGVAHTYGPACGAQCFFVFQMRMEQNGPFWPDIENQHIAYDGRTPVGCVRVVMRRGKASPGMLFEVFFATMVCERDRLFESTKLFFNGAGQPKQPPAENAPEWKKIWVCTSANSCARWLAGSVVGRQAKEDSCIMVIGRPEHILPDAEDKNAAYRREWERDGATGREDEKSLREFFADGMAVLEGCAIEAVF